VTRGADTAAASLHVSVPLPLIHEFYRDNHGFNPK
jgi:hypothetical protein